jgi:hypothetical protein
MTNTDYRDIAKKNLKYVMDLIDNNDGWEESHADNHTVGHTKLIDGSPIKCVRATSIVTLKPKDMIDQIWEFNHEKWNEDGSLRSYKVVEDIDDDTRIIHKVRSLPWPLWDRDFCEVQARFKIGDSYYLIMQSVEHNDVPDCSGSFVRANTFINAFCFCPDPENENNTIIHRIVHIDPCGDIPAITINNKMQIVYKFAEHLLKHMH